MNENEIGRELEALVPEPPATPDRAARAVALAGRRRRRRAQVFAAAAVVAVVGAGVVVTKLPDGEGRTGAPAAAPSSDAAQRAAGDVKCPEPLRRRDPAPQMADERPLPEGAVVARLCPVYAGFGFAAPVDALTSGVDAIIDKATKLQIDERAPSQQACGLDAGITYLIELGYPDGSTRHVYGQNFGCRWVEGAGPKRFGAEELWSSYLAALREQRSDAEPPADVAARPACPGKRYPYLDSPMASTLDSEQASLCWRRTDTETDNAWTGVVLTPAQLETILTPLRERASRHQPTETECRDATLQFSLVGVNAWGDVGHTSGDCGVFYVDDTHPRRLDSAAQRVVDELVAQHGTTPTPGVSGDMDPDEALTAYVDLLNDPARRDEVLDLIHDPALKAAYEDGLIDIKVEGWKRIPTPRRISAPLEMAKVEAIYRVQPPRDVFINYRRATFTMSRLMLDDPQPWQVLTMEVGAIEPTGR